VLLKKERKKRERKKENVKGHYCNNYAIISQPSVHGNLPVTSSSRMFVCGDVTKDFLGRPGDARPITKETFQELLDGHKNRILGGQIFSWIIIKIY